MKTAQEWYAHLTTTEVIRKSDGGDLLLTEINEDQLKQIQLDAMKEGMRRAAGLCDEEFFEHNECRKDILSASDQLTLNDL